MGVGRALMAAGALCVAAAASACGDSAPQSDATEATAGATGATSHATSSSTQSVDTRPDCGHADTSSPATFDPARGSYATHIVAYDAGTATVTFDIVQWL